MFMTVPGLKIVLPATPADAKGLMKQAVREDDPVIVFEDGTLAGEKDEVPESMEPILLGKATVRRPGRDVTIVAIAGSVRKALAAAEALEQKHGISAEVIDPRTVVPLDKECVLESVHRTGRLVIAEPAARTCGAAAEISAIVAEEAFADLRAPIVRVTAPDVPVPFSPPMERPLYPTPERIAAAAISLVSAARIAEKSPS
jgi:pyruvate dehydrogenase E1 component beta subunit